jgi:hypothetical protein
MSPAKLSLAFTAALALAPSLAVAQPCARERAGVPLPIALGVGPADFGTTPSPCGDARIGLDLRGGAIIDTADFYGALGAEAVLSGTVPLTSRMWLSGAFTALRYRFVQNATLIATDLGLGPSDVGFHVALITRDDLRVSTYLRVLLPTETPTQYALRTGFEAGAAALYKPHRRVSLLGGVSVPVEMSFLGGRGLAYGSVRASVDAALLVATWFEPALGVELRVGNDPAGPLDYVAPRFSLRAHLSRRVMLHLTGMAPLAGLERTNARVSLGLVFGF